MDFLSACDILETLYAIRKGKFMGRYYEDLQTGEEYISPGRTITETDVVNFACFSADWFSIHTDEEYAKKTQYKTRIAHGLLGLALTDGLKIRIPELASVHNIATIFWNYNFRKPIHIGDTVRVKIKIKSMRETKKPDQGLVVDEVTMLNQHNEIVGEGEHGLLILRRTGSNK